MILAYFIAGLIFDAIITRYQLHVVERRAWQVAAYSFIITVVGTVVVQQLVLSTEFIPLLIAYALGCAAGSFAAIKLD
jgi:hypothetical protein